jgi:hypothetical protein
MESDQLKQDIVTASHILNQQGIAAAFGHVSARIPGTDTFIFPPRTSPALARLDNLLTLAVDGQQLSVNGATATGVTANHSYSTPGSFIARLTVTDNLGASNSTTTTILVHFDIPLSAPSNLTPTAVSRTRIDLS